jgi:hypothetical protein
MNTRKEYPTFEELWTCCAQEESRISAKEKPQKKYDDQAFTARFKNFRNKRKFGSRRKESANYRSTGPRRSQSWKFASRAFELLPHKLPRSKKSTKC